ncbi:MAG: hypothetical protein JNM90_10835 [Burkholderiales bacterium]|nr:hypothetical protein [Burkholderiales bacterium]
MPEHAHDAETIARTLLEHRDRSTPNPVQPGGAPFDAAIAYAAQAAMERILVEERGYRPIGYKIAATNAASRHHLKIAGPFYGRLYDKLSTPSPAALAFTPNFLRVHEPEIALEIGRDLRPEDAPFDAVAIMRATHAVLPAIEIIGTWYTPWTQAGAANLIADNAAHGHWIFGAATTAWQDLDLLEARISLSINGGLVAAGQVRNVDDGAFGAAAWLANALAAAGRTLKAGEFVTTGSVTAPQPVAAGQSVSADFGPLGNIVLTLDGH